MDDFVYLNEWQIKEILKCAKSPWYFLENFCWIEREATGEVLPFNPFPKQRLILQHIIDNTPIVVNKSRRVGWSWIIAGFCAHNLLFNKNSKILILSRTEDEAMEVLDKVKFIYNNLRFREDGVLFEESEDASWMKREIVVDKKTELSRAWRGDDGSISSLSKVLSLTNSDNSGRGKGCQYLFMDEFAFYDHDWQLWNSISKTIIGGGFWAAGSTPNGIGNKFHQLASMAEVNKNYSNGKKLYEYITFHWSESWISQEEVDEDKALSDEDGANQEWELEFITPSDTAFNSTHLAACFRPLDEYPELAAELEAYRDLVFSDGNAGDHEYYSGADTMLGKRDKSSKDKDWNAFTAMTPSAIQAFAYADQSTLDEWGGGFADTESGKVFDAGILSNLHADYPGDLRIEEQGGGYLANQNHVTPNDGFSNASAFHQSKKTKHGGVHRLSIAINTHQIIITDLETYRQLQIFQDNGPGPNRYSAPRGYSDDLVLVTIIAHENVLNNGAREFSWGGTPDDLKRESVTGKVGPQMFGPSAILTTIDPNRMTDIVDGARMNVPGMNEDATYRSGGPNGMRKRGVQRAPKYG